MARCAIVGASGYSGAELAGLVASHPDLSLVSLHAESSAGQRLEDLHPRLASVVTGELKPFDAPALAGLDVVFLALPHGASARAARDLVGKVGHVIDLSGDLRLADAALYRRWYGQDHPAPELLGRAAYGLPELAREPLRARDLVACAGCYATAAQLAAAPALALGSGPASITVAASSGTSGAGRKSDLALSFSEVASNLRAYRVGRHQHVPEIAASLERRTGRPVRVTFVPQLVPIVRGILASVVLPLEGRDAASVLAAYRSFYADAPFVHVVDPARRLPEVADVVSTNACHVAPVVDEEGGSLVVISVLDNLVKGAAGQALQVANLVLGFPETTGLSGARPGAAS